MTIQEVLTNARAHMSGCSACPVCNGKACGNHMPGPGAKGYGDVAMRNFDAWKDLRINMDTLSENVTPDTSFDFFGHKLKYPVFAGPVGAVNMHYGDALDDVRYNDILVKAAAEAGILAFTGDGTNPAVMEAASAAIKAAGGNGVPTVKPWDPATVAHKMELVKASGAFAVAMDVDAAGLPFLANCNPPAGSKTVPELAEIIKEAGLPFIVKGIMTVNGAKKAVEAGASAIIVSNHGGRVLDGTPATAEVLPEIADAVGDKVMILVDGGIRDGVDVFRALALGADAVLIARPYVVSVYGGIGQEDPGIGVKALTGKIGGELRSTMKMCGVKDLAGIGTDNLYGAEWI